MKSIFLLSLIVGSLACSCIISPPFTTIISEITSGQRTAVRGRCLSRQAPPPPPNSNSFVMVNDIVTFQIDEIYSNSASITLLPNDELVIDAGSIGMCGYYFECDATGQGPSYFVELYSIASSLQSNSLSPDWGTSNCASTRPWSSISPSNQAAVSSINCGPNSCMLSLQMNTICPAPAEWAISGPTGVCQLQSSLVNGVRTKSCVEVFSTCPSQPYSTCMTCTGSPNLCMTGETCTVDPTCTGANCESYCLDTTGNCPAPYMSRSSSLNCMCMALYAPVCGVDGVTYGNDCELGCAGVAKASDGECVSTCAPCGGIAGFQCPNPTDTCYIDPNGGCNPAAGGVDCMGICVDNVNCFQPPTSSANCICPMVYSPVCGVDGKTYGNDCEIGCAGVAKASDGECGGLCACPEIFAPVCGSDGATYSNDCVLTCQSVGKAYDGACDVKDSDAIVTVLSLSLLAL